MLMLQLLNERIKAITFSKTFNDGKKIQWKHTVVVRPCDGTGGQMIGQIAGKRLAFRSEGVQAGSIDLL